jgi:hypothetical protein
MTDREIVMNIRSKFEIGQRLWPICRAVKSWNVHPPFDLQFVSTSGSEIMYSFTTDYAFPEIDVFSDPQEAKFECDRRNGI